MVALSSFYMKLIQAFQCSFSCLIGDVISLFVQRDTNGLTVENNELKLRLQTMEQQVHLQDGEALLSQTLCFPHT